MPVEIPIDIVTIGSPRTKSDFKALESKIHKWKETKVNVVQDIIYRILFNERNNKIFWFYLDRGHKEVFRG